MLNFSTFNLSKYNISSRKKTEGPKLFSLDIFGLELEKATVLWFFYISTYKFFQIKFCPKIKILKFGTKIVLIGYFGMDFQKLLNFSILEFVNMQSFIQKQRNFKLGTKNTLLRYFWTEIYKNYFQIFNQHNLICETIKFHPKRKNKSIWEQKCTIWVFGWNVEKI